MLAGSDRHFPNYSTRLIQTKCGSDSLVIEAPYKFDILLLLLNTFKKYVSV